MNYVPVEFGLLTIVGKGAGLEVLISLSEGADGNMGKGIGLNLKMEEVVGRCLTPGIERERGALGCWIREVEEVTGVGASCPLNTSFLLLRVVVSFSASVTEPVLSCGGSSVLLELEEGTGRSVGLEMVGLVKGLNLIGRGSEAVEENVSLEV